LATQENIDCIGDLLPRVVKKVQYWRSGMVAVNMEWSFKNAFLE